MIFWLLVACLGLFTWLCSRRTSKHPLEPPAGPWGLPLVGVLFFVGDNPAKAFLKWKKTYGPVFSIQLGSFNALILNDSKSIKEAFNLPSLCSRPDDRVYKAGTGGKGLLFSDYEEGKEQRMFITKSLKRFGLRGATLETKVNDEIQELLEILGEGAGKPFKIHNTFNSSVVNSLWSSLMSDRFKKGDKALKELVEGIARLSDLPGVLALLGLYMPWLADLLPGPTAVTSGRASYRNLYGFMQKQIDTRKKTRTPNEPRDVTDAYIDKVEETTDSSSTFYRGHFQSATTGDLFYAGTDTISNSLSWSILFLCKFESIQRELHSEIGNVIGARLPALSDRVNMPYADAVIHETLRYSSVAPFGLPHHATEDTKFRDYVIPRGTMILENIYGAHHDPEIWGDPSSFRPSRFLDEDGNFKKNDNFIAFSGGKRVCLGETFARDQLFLFITRIFQKFSISFAPGNDPPLEGKFGFVFHPEPFQVIFTER